MHSRIDKTNPGAAARSKIRRLQQQRMIVPERFFSGRRARPKGVLCIIARRARAGLMGPRSDSLCAEPGGKYTFAVRGSGW